MRSPSMRTDARRGGEPEPSMTFALVMRKLDRAGVGAELVVHATVIAAKEPITRPRRMGIARYAWPTGMHLRRREELMLRIERILRISPRPRKATIKGVRVV